MRVLSSVRRVLRRAFLFALRGLVVGWWAGGVLGAAIGFVKLLMILPLDVPLLTLLTIVHRPALAGAWAGCMFGCLAEGLYGATSGSRTGPGE